MSLFTEAAVRQRAQEEVSKRGLYKKAEQIIVESMEAYASYKTYDIFLSHSVRDANIILGVKAILEDFGYSVYVDWIDDPKLDRSNVTAATAALLRERMSNSKALFFVTTSNSSTSKWMPWECGYFDGKKEKVAIVPVLPSSFSNAFYGQEYLGLYPYTLKDRHDQARDVLWIHKDEKTFVQYDVWVKLPNSQVPWRK